MKITIADAVFAAVARASDRPLNSLLLSLLQLGLERRHRIIIDPPYEDGADRHVNRWLAGLGPIIREEFEHAFHADAKAEAFFSLDVEIRVDDVPAPDWQHSPPVLPLEDALQLARRPLEIFVEDAQTDGLFFRYIAPPMYASMFEDALRKRWIDIRHGGGISSLKKRMEAVREPDERLRMWVMFDSDRLIPGGQASEASRQLKKMCKRREIPHHQLERRAIENYLPCPALDDYTQAGQGHEKQEVYKAFSSMSQLQRCCYNMKAGFKKDRFDRHGKERPLPEHFGDRRDEPALQDGFGDKIWESVLLPHGNKKPPAMPFPESWLQDDGSRAEAQDILLSLLKRL